MLKRLFKENFFYLIDSMEYDQTKYAGPPRSVPVEEIETLFGTTYPNFYLFFLLS